MVDIYGQAGFRRHSITDHVYNSYSTISSWAERLNKTIAEENFPGYMETSLGGRPNGKMAQYGMPADSRCGDHEEPPFKGGVSRMSLLLDLSGTSPPTSAGRRSFERRGRRLPTIRTSSSTTPSLLEPPGKYRPPCFDAWEVANRTDLFSVVSLSDSRSSANGDVDEGTIFILERNAPAPCLKNVEAVKECIRENRGVAIRMFSNGTARGVGSHGPRDRPAVETSRETSA